MSVTLTPVVIEVTVGDNVAIACLQENGHVYKGEAKRAPGDPRNPSIGRNLAVARCLKSYGEDLESRTLRISDALNSASIPQQGGSQSPL